MFMLLIVLIGLYIYFIKTAKEEFDRHIASAMILWYHAVLISIIGSLKLSWPDRVTFATASFAVSFMGVDLIHPRCLVKDLGVSAFTYYRISTLCFVLLLLVGASIAQMVFYCVRLYERIVKGRLVPFRRSAEGRARRVTSRRRN